MKKKLLALLLSLSVILALTPATALAAEATATKLPTPQLRLLTQDETIDGRVFRAGQVVMTDIPQDIMPDYHVTITNKDTGKIFEQYGDGFGGNKMAAQEIYIGWYENALITSGNYTISVFFQGDGEETYLNGDPAEIDYTYVDPNAHFEAPTTPHWTENGNFGLTLPENANNSDLIFMRFGLWTETGTREIGMRAGSVKEYLEGSSIFIDRFIDRVNREGEGDYVFSARIISQDITKRNHSLWSDWSKPRHISPGDVIGGGQSGGIDGILDRLPAEGEPTDDAKNQALTDVRALDRNELKQSLVADNQGTGITAKMIGLEEKLGLTAKVEASEDAPIQDVSKISVVGAGLNSNNLTPPVLTISKAPEDLEIPNTYKSVLQVNLDLGENVDRDENGRLPVPIRVTMPVPHGMNPQRLAIFHFGGDSADRYERVSFPAPYQAEDGTWMVSFVVDHLSPFVFAEENEETPPQSACVITVSAEPSAGGTVSGGGSYAQGTSVTVTAAANSGYTFSGWMENGASVSTSASYTFTAAEDRTLTAKFTKTGGGSSSGSSSSSSSSSGSSSSPTYTPNVRQPSVGGTITVSPANPKRGDTVTVKPTPDQGYQLERIIVIDRNGKTVKVTMEPDGAVTFKQPAGKVKIEAVYQAVEISQRTSFADVAQGAWYYEAVQFAQEEGLMSGYSDGRFAPYDNLSRAQLAQILFNKEGRSAVNGPMTFSDVDSSAWYAEAIRWAASQGIVSGYGNGNFGPNDPISREQLAMMLWRYSGSPATATKELRFSDAGEAGDYARDALRWAVENGILNGYEDGRLGPKGLATRAQVAQLLKNYLEH